MPIQPGDRLGAYEIVSPLGAGGMGVVYRARDTRLGRDVAIKTLPDDVAADPERRSRFEREARALAALSHPNVASIFGFEQAGDVHLLVMELVEGETLADWIARGPIAADRALPIFLQIAAGLEAAHTKGIVHRDLKPANIKIAGSASARDIKPGAVKILDFGLAKALASEDGPRVMAADATHSPTLTMQATMRGELLGTAAYMSPEQAEGEPADQRADIWAFGVCLLEALTGRPVFTGSNASRVLASVLKDEPDLERLPPATPSAVRRLLRRCLRKDRDKRLRDIADARLDLEEALEAPVAEAGPVPVATRSPTARTWMAIAVAFLLGSAISLVIYRNLRPSSAPPSVTRFVLNPPPNVLGGESGFNEVALTADGKAIVYAAGSVSDQVVFARRIDQLDGAAIRGVEPVAYGPFLSPDGRWVGYVHRAPESAGGTLRKIALEGGRSVEIAKMEQFAGASWSPDNVIVFGQMNGPLRSVSASGGETHDVVELREGEVAHRFPEWMPGGQAVLFTVVEVAKTGVGGGPAESTSIEAVTLATGERKTLVQGGSQAKFLPPGHLLYAAGSTLNAVAFDPERLELRGSPVPVQENIARTYSHAAKYATSESGAFAFGHSVAGLTFNLVWVDRDGQEEPLGAPLRNYGSVRLSPDGTRIAFDIVGELDIGIWDVEREASSLLTVSDDQHLAPLWSPDGRMIFHSTRLANGNWVIVGRRADGSGHPLTIIEQSVSLFPLSVTADGAGLLAMRGSSKVPTTPPFEIVLLDTSARADPKVLLGATGSSFTFPELSPDGRFLAYVSDESGSDEVYVRPYPALDSSRSQVSSGGGTKPLWSRDGREIFFLDSGNHLTAAAVTTRDGSIQIGRAEILIQTPYPPTSPGRTYDLSPDGKRFLVTKAASAGAEPNGRIVYVQNWLDELRRTVPSRASERRK